MTQAHPEYRVWLMAIKEATRKAGITGYAKSKNLVLGPYTVYCDSELKFSKFRQVVQRNTWWVNDVRHGENHMFSKLKALQ